jgi:hypothetical protein
MKNSIYLLFGFALSILMGCDRKQMNENANKNEIAGIWQNTADSHTAIEFTKDGEYYFRLSGKRVITCNSKVLKYFYDSLSNGSNLKICGDMKGDTSEGKLVFVNPDKIKFSLFHKDTIVSVAEYIRMKK